MLKDTDLLKSLSVLLVEDNETILNETQEILDIFFDKVFIAVDGQSAYDIYHDKKPDLIISDIMLPVLDGLKLTEKIRQIDTKTPIVLISAYSSQDILLAASNASIDGYIIKPIELDTLLIVILKAIKRGNISFNKIFLNKKTYYTPHQQDFYKDNMIIPLTKNEKKLIVYLMDNMGRVVPKEELIYYIWPSEEVTESAYKNLLSRIRSKIGKDIILSIKGVGVYINLEKEKSI